MSGRDAGKLSGATDYDKLQDLCTRTYKEQAIWFLNAYWGTWGKDNSEKLWDYVHKCNEFDLNNHENGCALDEMNAHRLLEAFDETLTVRAMREQLRGTGAITNRVKEVPLTHILTVLMKTDWHDLVNASQGSNQAELIEAQKKLDEVQKALDECKAREAEAREAEAPFKAAQEEVEAALAEVKAEEDLYNGKIEDCKRRSEEGGVVSRNKAKNELAQLLAEDPLPLRKAKITLEAAKKRAEKARAPFEAAREVAEAAVEACLDRFREAEAYLEEVKAKPGSCDGALWWMDRELHEQKKYMPTSKGGISK